MTLSRRQLSFWRCAIRKTEERRTQNNKNNKASLVDPTLSLLPESLTPAVCVPLSEKIITGATEETTVTAGVVGAIPSTLSLSVMDPRFQPTTPANYQQQQHRKRPRLSVDANGSNSSGLQLFPLEYSFHHPENPPNQPQYYHQRDEHPKRFIAARNYNSMMTTTTTNMGHSPDDDTIHRNNHQHYHHKYVTYPHENYTEQDDAGVGQQQQTTATTWGVPVTDAVSRRATADVNDSFEQYNNNDDDSNNNNNNSTKFLSSSPAPPSSSASSSASSPTGGAVGAPTTTATTTTKQPKTTEATATNTASSATSTPALTSSCPSLWTEEDHRSFVEAIYEIGLKHASPSVILEKMVLVNADNANRKKSDKKKHNRHHPQLTSERVKSHLQKYRNNKIKSYTEFMGEYDAWMQKALTVGAATASSSHRRASSMERAANTASTVPTRLVAPRKILDIVGCSSNTLSGHTAVAATAVGEHVLLGGDLPAFLTYCVMWEEGGAVENEKDALSATTGRLSSALSPYDASSHHAAALLSAHTGDGDGSSSMDLAQDFSAFSNYFTGTTLPFPILTREERNSPLGASIGHVISLFHTMTQHIMRARVARGGSEPQSSKEQQQQQPRPLSEQNNGPDQRMDTQVRHQLRMSSGDEDPSSCMEQNNSLQQQRGRNQAPMMTWVAPGMNQDQELQQQSIHDQNLMQNNNFTFTQHFQHSRNLQNLLYQQHQEEPGQQEIDHQQQYQQISQLTYQQQQLQSQVPQEHIQYFSGGEASYTLDQDALNAATGQTNNDYQFRPQFVNDASASSKSRSRPRPRDREAAMQRQQRQALEFHYRFHHNQNNANSENNNRRKERQMGERRPRSSHSTSGRER